MIEGWPPSDVVCGPCCTFLNNSFISTFEHQLTIYYTNFAAAAVFLWNVIYLSFRLNKAFSAGNLLRVYHGYTLFITFWFVLALMSLFLPANIISWTVDNVLYASRAYLDSFIIILSCFPGIAVENKQIVFAVLTTLPFLALKITLMAIYVQANKLVCGLCPLFYPSTLSAYTNLIFSGLYLIFLLITVISKPIRIRPPVKKWLIFVSVTFLINGGSLLLVNYQQDTGFCIITVITIVFSVFYGPLMYYIFIEDSNEVVSKSITSGNMTHESDPVLYYGNKIKQEKNTIKLLNFDDLKFGAKIGIGGYGEVSHGRWHHTDVAIKRVFQKSGQKEEVDDFLKEIKMMSKLTHPNIILFIGACVTATDVYIITEYMRLGSVYSILHSDLCRTTSNQSSKKHINNKHKLTLYTKLNILLDSAKGMLYLHSFNPAIIHRDLKTQNLLVDEHWRVKLCDFGLSRIKAMETMSRLGTLQYSAPEILRGERYSEKADVYSFGIITWEIITEGIPYDGWPPLRVASDVAYKGRRPDIPVGVLPEIQSLMRICWEDDPNRRLDFSAIIQQLDSIALICRNISCDEEASIASSSFTSSQTPLLDDSYGLKNYTVQKK